MGIDTRPCPFCAEDIKKAAIVCRYCNRDVPAVEQPSSDSVEQENVEIQQERITCWRCGSKTQVENEACTSCGIKAPQSKEKSIDAVRRSASKQNPYKLLFNESGETQTFRNEPLKECPVCGNGDNSRKVSNVVDSSSYTSSSFSIHGTIAGGGLNNVIGRSVGESSTSLARRLTITAPQAGAHYGMLFVGIGVAAALGYLGIFHEGGAIDLGTSAGNGVGTTSFALTVGLIIGWIFMKLAESLEENRLAPVKLEFSKAQMRLRSANYCMKDDVVFDQEFHGSPEQFVRHLISQITPVIKY